MYVTNCIPGVLAHNFIGTDDVKLHSFDTSQVGRRECKALASSQPHSWVISAMAFRHQKATQISKNYESRTSQKPAQQERRQRMEFYERRISPKVGDHEFGGRTWNFKRTTKTANIPGIPKRGAREAKKPDGILQNHVKPQNKGDDHKIWKQKSFHVCED